MEIYTNLHSQVCPGQEFHRLAYGDSIELEQLGHTFEKKTANIELFLNQLLKLDHA